MTYVLTLPLDRTQVNAAVIKVIEGGSFSTLNPPEEVELAELLISLHPWCAGGMARFARGGGEIDMLAARIARYVPRYSKSGHQLMQKNWGGMLSLSPGLCRAATQRDRIAICGYHGWTDWYIAANHPDPSPGASPGTQAKHTSLVVLYELVS